MEVLTHEQLAEVTGYNKPADIALCLHRQGVKYMLGKRGRIWTTMSAVNAALGICAQQERTPDTTPPAITLADFEVC